MKSSTRSSKEPVRSGSISGVVIVIGGLLLPRPRGSSRTQRNAQRARAAQPRSRRWSSSSPISVFASWQAAMAASRSAERPGDDLDPLVLVDLGLGDVGEARRVEQLEALVAEAAGGEEAGQWLPLVGGLADLLGQLALGCLQRRLALDVELARGQLEQVRDAADLARLADEPDVLVVDRDDADGARVVHVVALDLRAVLVTEALDTHLDDVASPDLPLAELLEPAAHSIPPRVVPAASAAAKNGLSSSRSRPIVRAGRPLAR